MKASVIMPVYNGSQYLAAAFESVLAQTYPLHEIIVIDDGSTDSSPDILRSYGDRLRVTRQDNQGIAAARNVGLRQVTGDVINFIDQDDLWPAGRTEALVRALQSDPDALVAPARWKYSGSGLSLKIPWITSKPPCASSMWGRSASGKRCSSCSARFTPA